MKRKAAFKKSSGGRRKGKLNYYTADVVAHLNTTKVIEPL